MQASVGGPKNPILGGQASRNRDFFHSVICAIICTIPGMNVRDYPFQMLDRPRIKVMNLTNCAINSILQ